MLTDGFYAEATVSYDGIVAQENGGRPFKVDALRPIQLSKPDVLDVLAAGREKFTTEEWKNLLIRSVGLEPASLDERAMQVALLRMVPFVERNYNFVELGPRGTGKSHRDRVSARTTSECSRQTWRRSGSAGPLVNRKPF